MRILFAAVFFLFLLATCWLLAHRLWRRSLLLSGPFALAILIGFQAVLLNILSLFGAVSALSLLCGNNLFIFIVLFTDARRGGTKSVVREYGRLVKCHVQLWSGRSNPLALLIAPLFLILFFTALAYPPNNFDSMTYHMARVVYWIENGSVAYFPTAIDRQNLMSPGSEYVILLLQLLSASDRLANLVQFISFYLLVSATPSFLRLLGIDRRIANYGMVLAATLPMGVLQATSTQNDLVASCIGLGLCVASLGFWHKTIRANKSSLDIMALALLGAVGYLVKVTAIIAALPFLLMAAWCYGIPLISRSQLWRKQAFNLILGILLVVLVSGPDLYRKKEYTGSFNPYKTSITFELTGEWTKKVINSLAGISVHAIPTEIFYKITSFDCCPFLQPEEPYRNHEDWAGNPLHTIFAEIAILVFLFRFPYIPRPARWGFLFVCASWILFHAIIRYQPWISRLQTPLFMLFPCYLASWSASSQTRIFRFIFMGSLIIITIILTSFGIITAARNEVRPLALTDFWRLDRESAYYANNIDWRAKHAEVLKAVERFKVKKVGLVLGPDDYDYPLSWRLYSVGVEVRHQVDTTDWADLMYVSTNSPLSTKNWMQYGAHNSILITNLRTETIAFNQTFDFNDLNPASPYSEKQIEFPFGLMPGDIIQVEFMPRVPIKKENIAYFIFYQPPQWQQTLLFHNNIVAEGDSARIVSIIDSKMENPTFIWRNWSATSVLPATRIIVTIWRNTAPRHTK